MEYNTLSSPILKEAATLLCLKGDAPRRSSRQAKLAAKNRFGRCAAVKWGQIACPENRFGRYALRYAAVKRGRWT